MTPKIEKGYPIPIARRYPFKHMQVGDSFFVPREPNRVSAAAACWSRRHAGFKFRTLKVREDGVCGTRCWRIPV